MSLQITAIKRTIEILTNLGCSYYITAPNGEIFGELPNLPKQRDFKHGEITRHIKPLLENTAPGQIVDVPFGKYPPKSIASTMTSWMHNKWGKGSYTYERLENSFSVLRLL